MLVVQQVKGAACVSADQGTARIPRELKLPRGSGLWELYPIRAERRRAVNIPIAPLFPPVAHPFGLQFAQFIAPVYLAQSAISSQTPMEKRRGACFTALPERKTWREKVEKLALFLIKSHLTETSSVLKRRWKKKRKRSLNLLSGLDYFCCGCQISGNTFIWHTLIPGQIHDIRPCIVRTELYICPAISKPNSSRSPRT